MKLTNAQMEILDRLQDYYDLSARQVARTALKRFGVKVTRQCIFKRLNALTVAKSALAP